MDMSYLDPRKMLFGEGGGARPPFWNQGPPLLYGPTSTRNALPAPVSPPPQMPMQTQMPMPISPQQHATMAAEVAKPSETRGAIAAGISKLGGILAQAFEPKDEPTQIAGRAPWMGENMFQLQRQPIGMSYQELYGRRGF